MDGAHLSCPENLAPARNRGGVATMGSKENARPIVGSEGTDLVLLPQRFAVHLHKKTRVPLGLSCEWGAVHFCGFHPNLPRFGRVTSIEFRPKRQRSRPLPSTVTSSSILSSSATRNTASFTRLTPSAARNQ